MASEPTAVGKQMQSSVQGIHVVAKPVGPLCNMNCEYCFYLEKKALFGPREDYRIPDDVLAAFIRGYIEAQPTPAVEFVWQGGEPTLLGLDFFERVIELQKPFARRKTITNSLQTNRTLLKDISRCLAPHWTKVQYLFSFNSHKFLSNPIHLKKRCEKGGQDGSLSLHGWGKSSFDYPWHVEAAGSRPG